MRPIPVVGTLLLGLAQLAGCTERTNPTAVSAATRPSFGQVPADGNGNKLVFVVNINNDVNCGTQTIVRNVSGWIQVRFFDQAGNRNVELDVFHRVFTFTNSAGESFVWHDAGPDRYWVEGGNLMVEIAGRAPGHVGTFVVNLATGEVVFSAGQDLELPRVQACAALT